MSSAEGESRESHSFCFFDLFNDQIITKMSRKTLKQQPKLLEQVFFMFSPIPMRSRWLIKATANGPNIFQLFTTHKTDSEKVPETHLAK